MDYSGSEKILGLQSLGDLELYLPKEFYQLLLIINQGKSPSDSAQGREESRQKMQTLNITEDF